MFTKSSITRVDHGFIVATAIIWVILIFLGTFYLVQYDNTPGQVPSPPSYWPSSSSLNRNSDRFTIVMAIHPKCSCSLASLGELSRILERHSDVLDAEILFIIPKEKQLEWAQSDNWLSAQNIKGARTTIDIDGHLAKIFNANTSGYTILFDKKGKLLFSGGITASRGHWGDNTGSQAIAMILQGENPVQRITSAFGCSLFNIK